VAAPLTLRRQAPGRAPLGRVDSTRVVTPRRVAASFALEPLDLLLLLLDPPLLAGGPLALLSELARSLGASRVVLALAPGALRCR
jgi:hypothetical protein